MIGYWPAGVSRRVSRVKVALAESPGRTFTAGTDHDPTAPRARSVPSVCNSIQPAKRPILFRVTVNLVSAPAITTALAGTTDSAKSPLAATGSAAGRVEVASNI